MEMFVLWEAPISMRVEWKCASMTSGGQCVMTCGTALMLLWSASSWDMHTQEVSVHYLIVWMYTMCEKVCFTYQHSVCRWQSIQQCSLWCWQWTNFPGWCSVHLKFQRATRVPQQTNSVTQLSPLCWCWCRLWRCVLLWGHVYTLLRLGTSPLCFSLI